MPVKVDGDDGEGETGTMGRGCGCERDDVLIVRRDRLNTSMEREGSIGVRAGCRTGDGFVVDAGDGLDSPEGGLRLELLRGRKGGAEGGESEGLAIPNSDIESESAGGVGKLFTAPEVVKAGMIGDGGEYDGFPETLWL